jgi:hypothetical protein
VRAASSYQSRSGTSARAEIADPKMPHIGKLHLNPPYAEAVMRLWPDGSTIGSSNRRDHNIRQPISLNTSGTVRQPHAGRTGIALGWIGSPLAFGAAVRKP